MRKTLFFFFFCLSLPIYTSAGQEYAIEGIMRYSDIEGGCWYLDADTKKYQLRGTPELVKRINEDGKYVKLLVRNANAASICMIGQMVEVLELLDTVRHPVDPAILRLRIVGKVRRKTTGTRCWYVRTANGRTYELQGTIPKSWRKSGKKFNERVRVIPGSFSKCGMQWVIIGRDTQNTTK